jgi:hypothetical protein
MLNLFQHPTCLAISYMSILLFRKYVGRGACDGYLRCRLAYRFGSAHCRGGLLLFVLSARCTT